MVRVREYNKRYFTIDFDSRVFFYAHTENSKKVSTVIPFSDLLDVKNFDAQMDNDNVSETSKTSRTSFMRRLSTRSMEELEEHRVTLLTRPARAMELLCSSADEATQWFEAINAAIATNGNGAPVQTAVLAPPATNKAGYPSVVDQPRISAEGYPTAGGGLPLAPVAATTAFGVASAATAADTSQSIASREVAEGPTDATSPTSQDAADAAPPPARGTFLDFNTELEKEEVPVSVAAESSSAQAAEGVEEIQQQDVTILSTPSRPSLSAADFGLDADDSDSDASDIKVPVGGGRGRGKAETSGSASVAAVSTAPEPVSPTNQDDASPAPSPVAGGPRTSYEDKNAGLTMQERLANLEFSDDEDDDDDPLGLGKTKAADG